MIYQIAKYIRKDIENTNIDHIIKYGKSIQLATDDLNNLIQTSALPMNYSNVNYITLETEEPNSRKTIDLFNKYSKLNTALKEACDANIATKKWSSYFTRSPAQQTNMDRISIIKNLDNAFELIYYNLYDKIYSFGEKENPYYTKVVESPYRP